MSELAIQTVDLLRRYGKYTAVNKLNLTIATGSIFGFLGPNGAGKTTTLRMLAGLLEPSSGQVFLHGQLIQKTSTAAAIVGYMPDFFGVYDDLRVWEYLDFYARCHGIEPAKRKSTVDGLLDLVDLSDKRNAFVQHLSRGMQQRLCLAHALVHDPKILLLDEPASGLDPQARVELRELLRTLRDMGKTIILSSHILNELEDICTNFGIMARGQLLAQGSLETLRQRSRPALQIKVLDDLERAMRLIGAQSGVLRVLEPAEETPNLIEVEFDGNEQQASQLLLNLARAELPIADFHREDDSLERLFLQLVNDHVTEEQL
ncbi:ABC transporter ATP-binding protein [Herpetosiphon giganteus]|uniref:ABC transporter ATP-binding protein n=1 Tax=Herpetosiphon giganteus TaxID=2029754 RepID=UPI00195C9C76|nr:ABC transporter ATP-binding protein [Herpetosiphon giganteus]MBM7843735.1 ABC-2 type transport system ATP-binding protein [Herpetosiphon giganteus]